MPPQSNEHKELLLAKVRQVMVMRGATISGRDLAAILAKNGLNIGINHAIKLRDKILGERKHRVDKKLAALHVSDIEDTNEEVITHCWDIILNKSETTHNKLTAMALLAELKMKTFGQLMDAGVFTRHIGQEDHVHTISPAVQAAIDCISMQFKEKMKPIIYQEAEFTEEVVELKKDEPKPNPNITTLPGGATVDNKGGPMRTIAR